MTVNDLHECIVARLEKEFSSLASFQQKPIKGYAQALPILEVDEEDDMLFPYFAVRTTYITFKDDTNRTETYLFFGVKEEKADMSGYFRLLTLMEKAAISLRQNCIVGGFWCEKDMEVVLQEDDSYPYFYGYIKTEWNLPDLVEAEVNVCD